MIEIGEKPILWHILKVYSFYSVTDFIICCGYKGYLIKEYFANYFLHNNDITFDLRNNSFEIHSKYSESWKITLVDTGLNTMTGGRLKKISKYLDNQDFYFTYGDGLSDINLSELYKFHCKNNKLATVTAVQPPGRFGKLNISPEGSVESFTEKPKGDGGWINGGFFVLNPSVVDFIDDDNSIWEDKPLKELSKLNQLSAYKHYGFWHPMDTLRDKNTLENLWVSKQAPWKIWE